MPKSIPKENIGRIGKEILNGKSKYQVAIELNVPLPAVYSYTKDLRNKALELHPEMYPDGKDC